MAENKTKTTRQRSPSFPFITLKAAVERVKSLYEAERDNPFPRSIAVTHWGYSAKSSGGLQTLAALKAFGLLDNVGGGRMQLTEGALDIVMPSSPKRGAALRAAALAPEQFRRLWEEHGSNPPSMETLRYDLVRHHGFADNAVDSFINIYDASIQYAGLKEFDIMDGAKGDLPDPPSGIVPPGEKQMHDHPPRLETEVPLIGIPLPRGNFVELRLKKRFREGEFEKLQSILAAMKWGLMEEADDKSEQGPDDQ